MRMPANSGSPRVLLFSVLLLFVVVALAPGQARQQVADKSAQSASISSRMNGGYLVNPSHRDLLLDLAGLGDAVGDLHPHERVHLHSKSFLNAARETFLMTSWSKYGEKNEGR